MPLCFRNMHFRNMQRFSCDLICVVRWETVGTPGKVKCVTFHICCNFFLPSTPQVSQKPPDSDLDEAPPWLQALRLLEEAARPPGAAKAAKTVEHQRAEGDADGGGLGETSGDNFTLI